jgi:hypothetical protein
MPFVKRSGASSQIDQKLKTKRQQIIEEERIRVLGDSLMFFYDKLMEKYELLHPCNEEEEGDDRQSVSREDVETFAREYAATKPIGF